MTKKTNRPELKPSGLNQYFNATNLCFRDYIELMQNIIIESRSDLNNENAGEIILANSPFSLKSECQDSIKNGLLLIHGLFDSPFYVQDLGNYFFQKGFHVNAILLPGHGTVPGDLLHVDYQEWLKAVNYGINQVAKDAENIYLAGYSLGGLLAIHYVLMNCPHKIKAIFLFAPALQPRSLIKNWLARHHKIFSWTSSYSKWYEIQPQDNYVKYTSYPFNAGYQACRIMDIVNTQLADFKINIPLFVVGSSDDETVSCQAMLSFFSEQPHPKNKMILYSNDKHLRLDTRVSVRPSCFPDQKVINFSHACLAISPDNPLLGITSGLKTLQTNAYFGSMTHPNAKKYNLSRLSYNPDFSNLSKQMDYFLDGMIA